ncbi:hypothetical protein FRB90_012294, partial [Tulasnella sp. 427]
MHFLDILIETIPCQEPKDQAPSPPFRVPTFPQNDALPAEVLIKIFDALIAISNDSSPKVIETVRLVCRSWQNAGRGMELLRISISISPAMAALLEHIYTTPLFQTQNRANIRMLNVHFHYRREMYRLEELLPLCRTSLQELVLSGGFVNPAYANLLQNAKQETGEGFYFPNITHLDFTKLGPQELYNFITAVDPSRLEYLRIWDTFFYYDYDIPEELDNLRFALLKEIRIGGYRRDDDPTAPWLFRVASNLEMLEFSIHRSSLPTFTQNMSDEEILRSLKTLKLWIEINKYDDLDPKSVDLAPLVECILPHNPSTDYKDMFTRPKEETQGTVPSCTEPQKAAAPKADKEPRDQAPIPPFRVETSPQNDALPAEILIDIFDALIAISKDSSPKVIQTLRL